jgi:hypothetical protein
MPAYFAILRGYSRLSKMLQMNICMQMLAGNSEALRQLHDK